MSFSSRDPTCKFMLATLLNVCMLNMCFYCVALLRCCFLVASSDSVRIGAQDHKGYVSAVGQGMNRESKVFRPKSVCFFCCFFLVWWGAPVGIVHER